MVLSSSGGSLAPFPAHWASVSGARPYNTHGIIARISLGEAEEMGNEGQDASEILQKAFPDTNIQLIQ